MNPVAHGGRAALDDIRRDLTPAPDGRFLLAVTALLLATAAMHALLTPLYRGPDETQHVDMVIHAFEERNWPDPGERYVDHALRASKRQEAWGLRAQRRTIEEATPRGDRTTWSELELGVEGREPNGGPNHISQHPFLYYAALAVPWGLLQSATLGLAHDQAASALRILNIVLLIPIPLLTLATGRRLGLDQQTQRRAALLLLFVPQLAHLGGLVSNDNLLVPLGAIMTYGLIRVAMGDRRLATGALLGVAVGVALLVKGLALFWGPALTGAYLVGMWRARAVRQWLRSGALAAGLALAIGGWWWIRNVVLYGSPQPSALAIADPSPAESLGPWLQGFGVRFVDGFWGRFGTLDTPLPRALTVGLWLLLVVLVGAGIASRRAQGGKDLRPEIRWLLVLPFALLAVLVVAQSFTTYLSTSRAGGMQGRYLFAGLTGVALLAARGLGRLVPVTEGALWRIAVVFHMAVLGLLLHSWWGPRDATWSWGGSVAAWAEWLPWPPIVVGVVGVAVVWLITTSWRNREVASDPDRLTVAGSSATRSGHSELVDLGKSEPPS